MTRTTMGVKMDEQLRQRVIQAARRAQCTPHWLMKNALISWIESLEAGTPLKELTPVEPPPPSIHL